LAKRVVIESIPIPVLQKSLRVHISYYVIVQHGIVQPALTWEAEFNKYIHETGIFFYLFRINTAYSTNYIENKPIQFLFLHNINQTKIR